MEAKTTNPTTIPAKCETLSYDGYTLQWEDDFHGPELNREDWNVELHEPGWVNHELQAYIDSPQTIYIQNSSLVLKPVEKKNPDGTVSYISGRVNTQHKHDFLYGIFEARIKVPAGRGFLPAFWMMPTEEERYGQWPRCGEIDIMEVLGHDTTKPTAPSTMATLTSRARAISPFRPAVLQRSTTTMPFSGNRAKSNGIWTGNCSLPRRSGIPSPTEKGKFPTPPPSISLFTSF